MDAMVSYIRFSVASSAANEMKIESNEVTKCQQRIETDNISNDERTELCNIPSLYVSNSPGGKRPRV